MLCPNCGETVFGVQVCDSGEPELVPGLRCPECGECIPDEEWEAAREDLYDYERRIPDITPDFD